MSQKEAPRRGLVQAAKDGKITNTEGADALGISVRQFRRLRAAHRDKGAAGLVHGSRGQPSPRRLPAEERERVIQLMVGKYLGFNDCHLTEKLRAVEELTLSRELVRRLRLEAKLPAKRKRRAPKHRRRRERAARLGALVLIDGSRHDWLEGRGPVFTLVGAIDDATGRILALTIREQEDLHGYMAMLGQVLDLHGVPVAFYGDRFGALVRNDDHWSTEEQLAGRQRPTLFGRVLEELGIAFIAANSPQAKGRVERMWETLQDRLAGAAVLRIRARRPADHLHDQRHRVAELLAPQGDQGAGPLPQRRSCAEARVPGDPQHGEEVDTPAAFLEPRPEPVCYHVRQTTGRVTGMGLTQYSGQARRRLACPIRCMAQRSTIWQNPKTTGNPHAPPHP